MNIRHYFRDLIGGVNISDHLELLRRSQIWERAEQIQYQEERLRLLVDHAFSNVQYYHDLFKSLKLTPNDIKCINDLLKLPVLNKALIKQNYRELLAKNHKHYQSQQRSTGGTTGIPFNYYSDKISWEMHWALKYRAWEWGGYKYGNPVGILGGASVIPDRSISIKRRIWNLINGFYPLPSSNVNDELLLGYSKVLSSKQIKFLRGYPSSIAGFAKFCLSNNIEHNFKSIITTAEVLTDEYKKLIKEAFKCSFIDTYGCADGGGNANTCEHDAGFHVSFEASIWEVCDESGNPVPEGDSGEVTLTSLTNYAMPLLRYQPGDVIENSFNYDVCSCGRTLPRIKKILGRTTDILSFSNGRSLGGPAFTLLFREFPLEKYQLVQNNITELEINIIPSNDFTAQHEVRLLQLMQHHCGKEVIIKLNKVEEIALPKSGKHRFIINNTK